MRIETEGIGLLGSGGQADEVESFLIASKQHVKFRAVEAKYRDNKSVDIDNCTVDHRQTPVVAAIGSPAIRKQLIEKWTGREYITVISEHAIIGDDSTLGEGCIVAPSATLTTNIKVGNHSIINTGVTIGHDSVIGEYATLSPGAHIGGNVTLGDGVFVGIGASIKNGITVASGAVIGAGATVIQSIDNPNSVHVGTPAKEISVNIGWLREI